MNPLRLLLAEIRYRRVNFALGVLAVAFAATLFVAGPMLVDGYRQETRSHLAQWHQRIQSQQRIVAGMKASMAEARAKTAGELARLKEETRRLMRDMGFNLMIVHRDAKMDHFWDADYLAVDMPQEYVDRLAADTRLTYVAHLVATLQAKITWQNRKVLLVGYLPEAHQPHAPERSPMGYNIKPGTVFVGYELGHGRKLGETIEILGRPFQIARLLPEQGSKEDIMLAVHLEDAQALLNKPGRITQIMALECRCPGADLAKIRQRLAEVLPETKVTEFRSIALARSEQRALVEAQQKQILAQMKKNLEDQEQLLAKYREAAADSEQARTRLLALAEALANWVTPLVVVAAGLWVGLLTFGNVRERRTEIGLLRALGKHSGLIAWLFLGKALLLGLLGGLIGLVAGVWITQWLGVWALDCPAGVFALRYETLLGVLVGAPAVCAVASYLPMLAALGQDPTVALREP
ncbi:MAG: FtsX-like permease family protein [Thermoguttaceae bacterium]